MPATFFGVPDGGEPIKEAFIAMTDILVMESGREQRIPLRDEFFRRVTFTGVSIGARDVAGAVNALSGATDATITVPFWPDWAALDADAPAGSSVVVLDDLSMKRIVVGQDALLWLDDEISELVTIMGIDEGTREISLLTPTVYDYPKAAAFVPCVTGLIDNAVDVSVEGDEALTVGELAVMVLQPEPPNENVATPYLPSIGGALTATGSVSGIVGTPSLPPLTSALTATGTVT